MDLLAELVTKKNQGEDTCSCTRKYIVLIKWIEVLEGYLSANYDNGQPVDPPTTLCLTDDQINALVAKMKVMRGNNKYTQSEWLLSSGFWDDLGFWIDSGNFWNDTVPIV